MAGLLKKLSRKPIQDDNKSDAFSPSALSLSMYTSDTTNFQGVEHKGAYTGDKKILMIATEEQYVPLENGKFFSSGNHPVEMFLPLHHLLETGFGLDVATVSGLPVKLEMWAMPQEDKVIKDTYDALKPQLDRPLSLTDVVSFKLGEDSDYEAVFIPGGHGAIVGLPESHLVRQVLTWAVAHNKHIISLCHGPAALLAAQDDNGVSPFAGYSVCVFPDFLDKGPNIVAGYLPGKLKLYAGQALKDQGLTVVNKAMSGKVHHDRHLITGDSPLASDALGKLATNVLLEKLNTHA